MIKRMKIRFYLMMFDYHTKMMFKWDTSDFLEEYHDKKGDYWYEKARKYDKS